MNKLIAIIGGGLAGCEAAWQVADRKIRCILYEMRPQNMTPAHRTDMLGELICSSSLKSNSPETAHGLLKQEMRKLNSIILDCAEKNSVPGGDALCVDRDRFAEYLTKRIEENPYIEVVREEIKEIPSNRPCIIATGPLTSNALTESIIKFTNAENLHFFDAIAPSIDVDSINMEKVFKQSRYDKGEAAYLNCPLTKDEYYAFIEALVSAEISNLHLQEEKDNQYYEGCLPVEVMASRGIETLAHGMMKPVGLTDPKTGRWPYAVLQLRQENAEASVYGLVGFQTQLKQTEQERVFKMIPGLENAKFVRFGAVHRNTYINSPEIITASLNTKNDNGLFFAGQITGVEGYMESAATGIIAGINAARFMLNQSPIILPKATMIGSLLDYISTTDTKTFQPMNSNFGILPALEIKHKKHMRKELKIKAAVDAIDEFLNDYLTG